jgi:hypothetical protein
MDDLAKPDYVRQRIEPSQAIHTTHVFPTC